MNALAIKEVEVVQIEPGDIVVLTMPKDQYTKSAHHVLDALFPNNKAIILFEGMKISKITQEDLSAVNN